MDKQNLIETMTEFLGYCIAGCLFIETVGLIAWTVTLMLTALFLCIFRNVTEDSVYEELNKNIRNDIL